MNIKSSDALSMGRVAALVTAVFITALPRPAAAQVWSPDNQRLVVPGSPLVQVDVGMLLPETRANGPAPGPVPGTGVNGAGGGAWPAWSPDGKKLAFLASGAKLTVLDMAAHAAIAPDAAAVSPIAWSPDSKFLAYVRNDEKGALEMRTLHDNGDMALSVALPFAKLATGTMATIAWVPTTDNVIVAGGDGGRTDLYLIDQGQVVPLTTTGDVLGFAVSADGERVRWVMKSRNSHYILFSVYDLQISKRTLSKLEFPDRLQSVNPQPRRSVDAVVSAVISPDLEQIAFITRGGPAPGQTSFALVVTDVRGRHVVQVARVQPVLPPSTGKPGRDSVDGSAPAAPPALPAPVSSVNPAASTQLSDGTNSSVPFLLPAFSGDSRKVAFIRIAGDRRYLSVVNLDNNQHTVGMLP